MGLKVAIKKTELVILQSQRCIKELEMEIQGANIRSVNVCKYLGVYLNRGMNMTQHVTAIAQKGLQVIGSLMKIMPRMTGPTASKRRLISTVVISTLLYAAPTWSSALKYQKYEDLLNKTIRKLALLICSAYRTSPNTAIQVIAKLPPIKLLVIEIEKRNS